MKQLTRITSRRMKKNSDCYYVVRSGDTLSYIAGKKGVSVDTLKRINGIKGSMIMVGQKLQLRPFCVKSHTPSVDTPLKPLKIKELNVVTLCGDQASLSQNP